MFEVMGLAAEGFDNTTVMGKLEAPVREPGTMQSKMLTQEKYQGGDEHVGFEAMRVVVQKLN